MFRLARFGYTIAFILLLPMALLYLLKRSIRLPAYRRRIGERFARVAPATQESVWVHGVSVGESLSVKNFVEALLAQNIPVWFTTTTPTASEQVQRLFGDRVRHSYLPYDLPTVWSRFFHRVKPKHLFLVETEIWPNLMLKASQMKMPVTILNARLSERSHRRYASLPANWQAQLFAPIQWIAAQTKLDAERFADVGIPNERISTTGSLKFDMKLSPDLLPSAQQLRKTWKAEDRFVWVAASTHPTEETAALEAHRLVQAAHPNALLILVPRHPDRFDEVAQQLENEQWRFCRRSRKQDPEVTTDIFLADSMGELMTWYALADVAFVGGSIKPVGGHNPLEPAALKKPILMGPFTFNCQQIVDQLREAGGLTTVDSSETLGKEVLALAASKAVQAEKGENAYAVVEQHKGALEKVIKTVVSQVEWMTCSTMH